MYRRLALETVRPLCILGNGRRKKDIISNSARNSKSCARLFIIHGCARKKRSRARGCVEITNKGMTMEPATFLLIKWLGRGMTKCVGFHFCRTVRSFPSDLPVATRVLRRGKRKSRPATMMMMMILEAQ